mgnify:FL=1|tara:strand:+ start:491 stop:955 length:465 start_codon:yes stop_codon:yes gene_type:complete
MARITVEDCIDKFESRFELVLIASNRARKLHSGENPTVEKNNDKSTVIALREIADESISIDSLKDRLIQEYQTVSPLEDELSLDYVNSDNENKDDINQDEAQFKELNDEANTLNIDESISDESIEHKDDSILTLKNDTYTDITDDNNPEKSSQN